jgi:hypothetical protein
MLEIIMSNKFPTILFVLDLFAVAEKVLQRDHWGAIYWASAALLTASVVLGRH